MPVGTGLDGQIGVAEETAYGTYAAPTRFYEFNSEGISPQVERLVSSVLGRGRYRRTSRIRHFITGAEGDLNIDMVNKGMGLLLKHMFGTVATTQPDSVNKPNERRHRFTPDANGLRGLYLTTQVGRPSTDGTIQPFSYRGGKITGWEINAALNEIATLGVTMNFRDETTAQPLATPAYPADLESFTFLDGTLTMGGASVGVVNSVTLTGANAMNTDRRGFGNTKFEPLANDFWAVTGTFASEFEDMDAYNAWINGVEQTNLVLTFAISDSEIDAGQANPYQLVITIPSLHYTGDAPNVSGPDVVQQNKPFEAAKNETDAIITIDYHNNETAAA